MYYEREYIIGMWLRDDAGSSGQAGGMKECIAAHPNLNPRLPMDHFYVLLWYLTGNRDAKEAFLAMDDDINGERARYCK